MLTQHLPTVPSGNIENNDMKQNTMFQELTAVIWNLHELARFWSNGATGNSALCTHHLRSMRVGAQGQALWILTFKRTCVSKNGSLGF